MILVGNNKNSFKQHLEEMKLFRESHNSPLETVKMLKNMLVMYKANPPRDIGLTGGLTNNYGNLKTVPIWNITLVEGIQN
jgi:hypothetical protein